jgi:hypothetical protein
VVISILFQAIVIRKSVRQIFTCVDFIVAVFKHILISVNSLLGELNSVRMLYISLS